jgi:hypothetical protein
MITIRIPGLCWDFINQVVIDEDRVQGDMVPIKPIRDWLDNVDHKIRWIKVPNLNDPPNIQDAMVVDLDDTDAVAFRLTFGL